MKWRAPQAGDRRTCKNFAVLPFELDNGIMIWLEPFLADQVYESDEWGKRWISTKYYQASP